MNCISWPKIFTGNSTNVLHDYDASNTCMHLLLSSESREMFGDPDFGIRLKRYTFNQNDYILRDILIDEIYTKIRTFCPQVYLDRNNVEIVQEGSKVLARIKCKNRSDFELNTYELVLFEEEE